jgi:hypothetical protein
MGKRKITPRQIREACEDEILFQLGPLSLTGGKLSPYEIAHMFFKAGVEWESKKHEPS